MQETLSARDIQMEEEDQVNYSALNFDNQNISQTLNQINNQQPKGILNMINSNLMQASHSIPSTNKLKAFSTQMKEKTDKVKKILIVDDEQFNRQAMQVIFEIIGFQNESQILVEARNGQQAFDIIVDDVQQNDCLYSSFDLIMMDF